MSTVSVSAPDPLGQKLGCGGAACQEYCLGTPEIYGRENVMRCHSLKGFHPKWWCLPYWRSFQISGTLIVIWCDLTRRILLRSDHSLSTQLYSSVANDLSSIEVKNCFFKHVQTISNYVALYNLIAKFKTKLPSFHRVGPSEGMCICGTAVWLIVSLHDDEIRLLSNSWSGFSWLQDVAGVLQRGQIKIWRSQESNNYATIPHAVQDVFECQIRSSFVGNCLGK